MSRFLSETADRGPRKAGTGDPRPVPAASPPVASVVRQIVRELHASVAEVATSGRTPGEVRSAALEILGEAEQAPLSWLHQRQREPRT